MISVKNSYIGQMVSFVLCITYCIFGIVLHTKMTYVKLDS